MDVEQFCTSIYLLNHHCNRDIPYNINHYVAEGKSYISISSICAAVFDNDYKQEHTYVHMYYALPESKVITQKLWYRRAADPSDKMEYFIPMDETEQFLDWLAADLIAIKQRVYWMRAVEAKYDFVTDAASLKWRES